MCELSDRRGLQTLMTQTPMKDFLEIYDLEFPPAPGTECAMMYFVDKFNFAVAQYLRNPIPISSAFDELKSMTATIKIVEILSDITNSYVELEDESLYDRFEIGLLESMIASLGPMKNQIIVFFGAGAIGRLAIAMAQMLPNIPIKILEPSQHVIEQTNIRGEMTKKYMHFFGQQSHAAPIISADFLLPEFPIPILADVIIFNTQFERHEEFSGLWKKIYQCERPIRFVTDQLLRYVCFENTPTGHFHVLKFGNKQNPELSENCNEELWNRGLVNIADSERSSEPLEAELPSCLHVLPISGNQATIDERIVKKDAKTQTVSKKRRKLNAIDNLSEIPIIPGRTYNFRPRNHVRAINQALTLNSMSVEYSGAKEIHSEASQMVQGPNHSEIQSQTYNVIGNKRNHDDALLEMNQMLNSEDISRLNTPIFEEEMLNEEQIEPWRDEGLREAMARLPNSELGESPYNFDIENGYNWFEEFDGV
ncbi:Protein CBG28135 [Caenorhabditis briggsae]|uniref:Protein CBG28135 n=1 Tax=Caenorhabditis briggsae TaxID=6238 RepID=B6IHX5_CAEBR|nr:Protein CBG28135 [Caenorhabditis briggsae]CAR99505.1 Protein CBG28135 [Caenorhabditis briggsae]